MKTSIRLKHLGGQLMKAREIVATMSRQFRQTYKLRQGFILSFLILSTLSAILIRPVIYAPTTVAGVSLAFLIGVNDE